MKIIRHTELDVSNRSFDAAMSLFRFSKEFPQEERYSPVDPMRRSSRSVCANLAKT